MTDGWGVIGRGGCIRVNAVGGSPSAEPRGIGQPGTLSVLDAVRVRGELPRQALLTTYVLNVPWILELFGGRCRITVVADYDVSCEPAGAVDIGTHIRLVRPPCMASAAASLRFGQPLQHAKLMVLRFDDRVRVIISSANLVPEDWSIIGQCVWSADFPLTDSIVTRGPFADEMFTFLRALLPSEQDAYYWTSGYDSTSARARLVYSIPGIHSSPQKMKFSVGTARLKQLFEGAELLDKTTTGETSVKGCTEVVDATSSMGVAYDGWLRSWPLGTPRKALSVIYPTATEMDPRVSGVFFCSERARVAGKSYFARMRWKDSQRAGIMSHAKMLFWLNKDQRTIAAYYGSANFSAAAWGTTLKNGAISISNVELGVLLLPDKKGKIPDMPSPFVIPPKKYDSSDVPFQQEHQFVD